jgi:hypothetical protein
MLFVLEALTVGTDIAAIPIIGWFVPNSYVLFVPGVVNAATCYIDIWLL